MHTQVTITMHRYQIESRISNWVIYLLNTDTPHTHPSDSYYTLTLYRKLCLQGVVPDSNYQQLHIWYLVSLIYIFLFI